MKRYILKICSLVFAALVFIGCNDSFLERTPLDQISNESFWSSENDLIVYNNSLYDLVRNDQEIGIFMGHEDGWDARRIGLWYVDQFSDNIAPRHDRQDEYQRVRAGKHSIPSNPFFYGYNGWNLVRAINVGLGNYEKVQVSDVVRNKYVGEARLMRGWFYADKINKFGTAQWVDKELNINDDDILYGTQDDRNFIMTKVLEDLDFAIANLPKDWGDGNAPGRINSWGALMVKSRVALFEGTWRKYHGLTNADMWLNEAATASLELMNNGPYSLYHSGDPSTSYNALHRMEELAGNPEVIYWRRYEAGVFTNHVQGYHKDYNGGATKSMVESYLCTDGKPITTSPLYQGDEVYTDLFENRDPRLRQTILHPDDQAIYNYGNHLPETYSYPRIQGMTGGISTYSGYHIIKVFNEVSAYPSGFAVSITPGITMRFAEALLNYAEAKATLGTLTQGDLDISINLIRDRVAMPHLDINVAMDPKYANDGISAVLAEIRRERRVELFMEGFRYDDLRRWKQGKKMRIKDYGMRWDASNKAAVDSEGVATVGTGMVDGVEYLEIYKGTDYETPEFIEGKHYLWPLPTSAISQNPNLKQTSGWSE